MLSEEQLLLINNLIYRSEFSCKEEIVGRTVKDIIKGASGSEYLHMTAEEWDALYELANSDETILNLTIADAKYDPVTGEKMACFLDNSKKPPQPYAAFAGTGENEWRDNCISATMADSPQQIKALDWLESLPYDDIVVSGHSKGGNKAMYVSVLSDKVKECYSFDGEGFSVEFCEKYQDEIAKNRENIHLIANYKDYVNCLMINIAGDVRYIVNDVGVSSFEQYHCPNALFKYDENGNIQYSLGIEGDQFPAMEMFNELSIYVMENATPAEQKVFFSVMGEALTKLLTEAEGGRVRYDILSDYSIEGMEIVLIYINGYLNNLKINDPDKYKKYKKSLAELLISGDSIWSVILGGVGYTILDEFIIDNIENGSILGIMQNLRRVTGKDIIGRDFSYEVEEDMIQAAKEVEEEDWWQIDKWDCWYRIEKLTGGLNWSSYGGQLDQYYKKIIDINDASVKDIRRIFENVRNLDTNYAHKVADIISSMDKMLVSELCEIRSNINTRPIERVEVKKLV